MEIEDIRNIILYEIDNINDIENICYTDRRYEQLCFKKEFWIHWYQKIILNFQIIFIAMSMIIFKNIKKF